jgi:hypothetical protein
MFNTGIETGKKTIIVGAALLAAACATPPPRAAEQATVYKVVRAPVRMPAGFDLASLELVGEARRLRVYTQLRGIDDPGDAKLLFPATVKANLGLTDQQANLLFHTGIRQSNRFETFDDSDTKVREGARQNFKGEKMDIVIEGEFVSERQDILDIAPYKKAHTSMRLIATMKNVNTGMELFPGAVSSLGEWGAVQGEGTMIPPNVPVDTPQMQLSIGKDFQHAMEKAINGAAERIDSLMRPVGYITFTNATSMDMVGGTVHGFQGGDNVVVFHVDFTELGVGKDRHRVISHVQPIAVAHCDGVGTETSHCDFTMMDPSVTDVQHPAMGHDFVVLSDRSAVNPRKN